MTWIYPAPEPLVSTSKVINCSFIGGNMQRLIKLELGKQIPEKRILLRKVENHDDLEQLYFILKAFLDEEGEVLVECWKPLQEVA